MKILYVEDEIAHVVLAQRTLEDNLHQEFILMHAETMHGALQTLDENPDIDLILSDLRLPDGTGLDLLKKVRGRGATPAVVLVTGQGDQEVAVAALKAGAADYLVKQSDYLHRLPVVIGNAVAQNRLLREQEALRQAEVKYQSLVEQIPAVVFIDQANEFEDTVYMSPRIEELTGYPLEQWYNRQSLWADSIHPDDRDRIMLSDRKSKDCGSRFLEEYRFVRQDGRVIWIKEDTNLICDTNGNPLYWQGILIDITREKESVEQIRQSEERFRRIFHASPIPTCVVSLHDDKLIDANQAFLSLLGRSLEEILGSTSTEIGLANLGTDQESLVRVLDEKGSIQGIDYQFTNVPNGPRDTIAYHELIELDGIACKLSMYYDVTEEKKAQSALQAERDFALQVLNTMGQGLTVTTKDGKFEYVNPAYANILGRTQDEILGKSPDDFTTEASQATLLEMQARRTEGLTTTYESNLIHKDSHEVPALITGVPRWVDNEIQGAIAVITDLTAQKNAEKALERQVQELTILHSVAIAEAESRSEDEVIERVTQIIAQIYPEQCGFLILSPDGSMLTPHRSYLGADLDTWQESYSITEGITGKAISLEKIIRVDDVTSEPKYLEMTSGMRSELCVPIRVNGQSIGVLNVESRRQAAFGQNDERFLNTVANSLGTALERLRFYTEEQRRSKELNALYQTTKALAQSLEPAIIAQNLVATMDRLLGYQFASIYLLDESGKFLFPLALSDKSKNLEIYEEEMKALRTEKRLLGQGIIGWVAQHGESIRCGDVSKEPRYLHVIKNIKSELCVPIIISDRVIGTLNIETTIPDAYTDRDESLLNALANSAAIAFENARRYKSELTRRQQAELLRSATASLASAPDLDSLYQVVLDAVRKLIPYDSASIQVYDENYLETVAQVNFAQQQPVGHVSPWETEKWGVWDDFWEKVTSPIIVPDTHLVEGVLDSLKETSIHSWLGAPIIVGERVFGMINLYGQTPDYYGEEQGILIQTFAVQAGIAIEKAHLFETEKKHHLEAELLREATANLATSLELEPLLNTILDSISKFVPYDSASIFLENPQGDLVIVATNGIPNPEKFIGRNVTKTQRWYDLAKKQESLIIPDTLENSEFEQWEGTEYIRSWMGIPLTAQDKVIGYINLDGRKANAFTRRDAVIAQTFANSAAIALGNARLYQDALRAAERRAVLHRISQDIVQFGKDLEQIYAAIHEAASHLMSCDVFIILLRDKAKNEYVSAYTIEAGVRHAIVTRPARTGLSALVIEEGQSIILTNEAQIKTRDVIHFGSPRHVQSAVAVPMRMGNDVIGMISAQSYAPYSYGSEEQALLEMLSTHAATAVENGRLFESEQKRRQEAENLRHAATVISSTLDLNQLLEEILKALKQVIYYDNASVFLLEGDWLRLVICHGFPNAERLINKKFTANDPLFQELCDDLRPIVIKDAQKDSRFKNWGDSFDVRGWMGVPLITRGRVIGYITLDNYTQGAYDESLVETVMAFANQAATGIENAWLFQEQARRAQIIQALADIANEIATTRDVIPVLDLITRRALNMLKANHVAIYLLQDDNVTLKTVTAHGTYQSEILSHTRKVGEGITGTIFLNGKAEIINDTQEDPRRVTIPGTREREEKLESLMSSPLVLRGKPIGVINAWRQKEDGLFNESELSFLVGIAHQVSICIESGRLFQETSRQAQEAAAIAEVGRDISSTLQLDVVLERIASYAMELLHGETSAVYLADENYLRAIAAFGVEAQEIKNDPLRLGSGILGKIALQNTGEIVNNTADDPRAIIVKGTEQIPNENLMGVPILLKDKHTGLLAVWRTGEGTDFKEPDLEFLTSLARQAAVAIENARLYDEKEHRVKELEIANRRLTTLRNIDAAIASSFDLRLTLNILMDQTINHLNVDAVDIGLYHADIQSLTYLASTGFQTASPTRPQIRLGDGLAGQVILRQSILQVNDLQNAPEAKNDTLIRREGFVSYIGIPLIVKGQIKGVFEVFQRTLLSPDRDWLEFLHTLAGQAAIAIDSSQLFEKLQRSNQELIQAYDKTLEGWARALEIRDSETEGHSRRVTEMTIRLAQYMGIHENELINIHRGVLLHDIGKIGVPDNILRKTGALTDHEWNEMRKHPVYAKELLKDISYLKSAIDIPYCHHEHWDGSGYPQGLKGEQIPLPARIFSVVDIWDALLSDRPYRKAWAREKVIQYLKDVAGTILDPKIVDIFLNMVEKETG